MQAILDAFPALAATIRQNPIVASAFSLWGLTVLGIVARKVPQQIKALIVDSFTIEVTFTNTGYWVNTQLYQSFCEWYPTRKFAKLSRKLAVSPLHDRESAPTLGPGYGRHIFWANGRLFWFSKDAIKGAGANILISYVPEIVTLCTFGRSKAPLVKLLAEFAPAPKPSNVLELFDWSGKEWSARQSVPKRPLESVMVAPAIMSRITKGLDDFYGRREWYLSKGISHKLCAVFHGVPGTGKTSLIHGLASKYDANVYSLNLGEMSNESLRVALSSVPSKSFILVEDFEGAAAVRTRTPAKVEAPVPSSLPTIAEAKEWTMLDLTTILNCLDGIGGLDETAIFFTTNHLEKVDPAMLRRGRMDMIEEIPLLTTPEIHNFVAHAYGKSIDAEFRDVAGCELHGLLLDHKEDFDGFYTDLIAKFGTNSNVLHIARG